MNPRLLIDNTSIVFKLNIDEALSTFNIAEIYNYDSYQYACNKSEDENKISLFYSNLGRKEYTASFVQRLFSNGSSFHSLRYEDKIIAGMWIHEKKLFLKDPSFYSLQNRRKDAVVFPSDVIYSSHNLVDPEYRGKHLYSILLHHVLEYYSNSKRIYLYMTSVDSTIMINSGMQHKAEVIAIIRYKRLLSMFWKKHIYYKDSNRSYWENIQQG